MNDHEINDIRNQSEFKGVTFSNFKKSDVKKELLNSLINAKIESACYWSAELICAGHFDELWENIMLFFSKHVHLSNCNIAIYLEMRFNDFMAIMNNGFGDNLLPLRNHENIRKLFCEIMCVLCDAKRRHSFDNVKIKADDLNIMVIKDKFKASSTDYGEDVFLSEDPKELFPFVNELAYSITTEGNNQMIACYWVEWIFEYELRCKKMREKVICERRNFANVETKYQKDVVWIIWNVFLLESEKRSKIIQKIINALLSLFCLKYKTGCQKRRKNILYLAITVLCDNFTIEKEIIRHSQFELVNNIKNKINMIYSQIKKNEDTGGTDYLFLEMKTQNLEKTIEKLEMMNTFGENFIPRL